MEMESIEDDEGTTLSRNTAFGHRFLLEKLTVEFPSWMKGTAETRHLGDNNQGASYNPDQVLPFEHAVMPFYTSRQALETTLIIGLLREREANRVAPAEMLLQNCSLLIWFEKQRIFIFLMITCRLPAAPCPRTRGKIAKPGSSEAIVQT